MNVLETIKNNYYALHGEYPESCDCEVVPLNGISQEIAEVYTDPALVKKHIASWKRDLKARDLKLGGIVRLTRFRHPNYKKESPAMIINVPGLQGIDSPYLKDRDLSAGRFIEVCYFSGKGVIHTEWVEEKNLTSKTFELDEVKPLLEWRDMQLEIKERLKYGEVKLLEQHGVPLKGLLQGGFKKHMIYSEIVMHWNTVRMRLP
jgi:hypothetical protein